MIVDQTVAVAVKPDVAAYSQARITVTIKLNVSRPVPMRMIPNRIPAYAR